MFILNSNCEEFILISREDSGRFHSGKTHPSIFGVGSGFLPGVGGSVWRKLVKLLLNGREHGKQKRHLESEKKGKKRKDWKRERERGGGRVKDA